LRCRLRLFVRISPKQLKYLRTAFRKIPNRAYSDFAARTLLRVGRRCCLR